MSVVQHESSSSVSVTLSDAAINRVKSYLATQGKEYKGIRLSVKKTGCSGLY